jgi:hypothetical protein
LSEAKLQEFIATNLKTLRDDLSKVRGCVEMGLKVITNTDTSSPIGNQIADSSPGTQFLRAKLEKFTIQKDVGKWVDAAVIGLIRLSDVSLVAGTARPIVRIAHLVPREQLDAYKAQIDALIRKHAECGFLSSGPWPPYSFISPHGL